MNLEKGGGVLTSQITLRGDIQSPEWIRGPQGEPGFSPTIDVKEDTDDTYILTITDVEGSYDTPNLKGSGGSGGGSGEDGVTFVPSVSEDGIISWTNDGNLPNPDPVNIMGPAGKDGVDGKDGINGTNGKDGENGQTPFIGTDGNWWIGSVNTQVPAKGQDGTNGTDGITPHIGDNGHWFIGDTDTQVNAQGPAGQDGQNGQDGIGVPAGGTTGQILAKKSNTDYDTEWVNNTGGGSGTPGEDGGYYEPSVDSEGNLSWTASKEDMPAVDTVNIKGPKGDDGSNGQDGQPGQDGENGATFTPTVDSSGNLSWSNDKSLPNPQTVNIKGPQGEKGADGEGLPTVTTTDNGKFARVVDGVWSAVALTNAEEVSY